MKLLALSMLCAVGYAAVIPPMTPTTRTTKEVSNGQRLAAGLPPVKPRTLYSPNKRVLAPRASAYPAPDSSYTLFGCVNQGTGPIIHTFTTMAAAEATCGAYTAAQGHNLYVIQNAQDVPVNFYCLASSGPLVSCPSTSVVYYTYNG